MKVFSSQLATAIQNGTLATCVKIVSAVDGDIELFTSHDTILTFNSEDYVPVPGLERITMNLRNNAEVSNQEFAMSWVLDLEQSELDSGKWDNATVSVFKVDWTGTATDAVDVFEGRIGLVQYSVDGFRADVVNTMKDLSRVIGVQTTSKCRHQLFNTASSTRVGFCGINPAGFTQTGTVSTIVSQKIKFTGTATGEATGWAANGIMTMTSGNNAGISKEVKVHTAGGTDTFEMFVPFPFTFTVGDSFSVVAGCDKTFDTCKSKFSNSARFGGFPHLRPEVNYK